jgi:hypothetical protein
VTNGAGRQREQSAAEVDLVVADDARTAEEGAVAVELTDGVLLSVESLHLAWGDGPPTALFGADDSRISPRGRVFERGDIDEGMEVSCYPPANPGACTGDWMGPGLSGQVARGFPTLAALVPEGILAPQCGSRGAV